MVYSLEPEPTLFERARQRFAGCSTIEIINGTSEAVFPELLPRLTGDVNFWLDGHYSGGPTFRGENDTPILAELAAIEANMPHFARMAVLIDDIRQFNGRVHVYGAYPTLDYLVDWSRRLDLAWSIEQDIFVARRT